MTKKQSIDEDAILRLLVLQDASLQTKGVPLCALEISQKLDMDIRDVHKKMIQYEQRGLVQTISYRQSYGRMIPYLGWVANKRTSKALKNNCD